MTSDPNDRTKFFDAIGFGFAEHEQAAGQAWELQKQALGGSDPRLAYRVNARSVQRFQGAYSTDGKPLMTVVLTTGLRLDLAVPLDDIPQLIEWL
jgi:hypothetical protein